MLVWSLACGASWLSPVVTSPFMRKYTWRSTEMRTTVGSELYCKDSTGPKDRLGLLVLPMKLRQHFWKRRR
ncbi:unnamed protein product [Amoebophrya sp. A25]|nr:unnamed protein product [Amoebophrya sp. A25]|eukprot:GSA25T00023347001.1